MLGYVGYEDESENLNQPVYTRDLCESLAKHMLHVKNLPQECMKFPDIVQTIDANDKDITDPTSYMS